MRRWALMFVVAGVAAGCRGDQWPSPPPVDPAAYRAEHDAFLAEEQAYLSEVLPITGIWPLADGETRFGSDPALPVALPVERAPLFAGAFRRVGDTVTVTPAPDVALQLADGSRLGGETPMQDVLAGPFRLGLTDAGDDRRWVYAFDTAHPAITSPPPIPSYPLDPTWRVSARLDRFDSPRQLRVPDVRGGSMEFTAVGQLVFRLNGEEYRLTAIGSEPGEPLSVWFKDETNGVTTYGGYRTVRPQAVEDGQWTVLDFNFTYNPPCAYSSFTTCPLPPPENRLPVAIEAGLKELPSASR